MKLVMDERLKHRIIGVAVIVSIIAIFVPAIMKKSSQRLEGLNALSVKLPPKPSAPQVSLTNERALFKTVKIAHVELPSIDDHVKPVQALAKAEPLTPHNHEDIAVYNPPKEGKLVEMAVAAANELPRNQLQDNDTVVASKPIEIKPQLSEIKPRPVTAMVKKAAAKPALPAKQPAIMGSSYSVQLATFSQQKNAQLLVNRLKSKGYQAFFNTIVDKQTTVYKVLVGKTHKKQQAYTLQQQLAQSMQLKGFVVPTTGIS